MRSSISGFLMLGRSETTHNSELFSALEPGLRLFAKRQVARKPYASFAHKRAVSRDDERPTCPSRCSGAGRRARPEPGRGSRPAGEIQPCRSAGRRAPRGARNPRAGRAVPGLDPREGEPALAQACARHWALPGSRETDPGSGRHGSAVRGGKASPTRRQAVPANWT